MQQILPLFPDDLKMVNYQVGFKQMDDFDSVILTLAFMYLCRIKSVEQLKHFSPGEMGKLLGLDRIPEACCLRGIIKELSVQERASEWNAYLSEDWINQERHEYILYRRSCSGLSWPPCKPG